MQNMKALKLRIFSNVKILIKYNFFKYT
jgi:hypothetical protein